MSTISSSGTRSSAASAVAAGCKPTPSGAWEPMKRVSLMSVDINGWKTCPWSVWTVVPTAERMNATIDRWRSSLVSDDGRENRNAVFVGTGASATTPPGYWIGSRPLGRV